LFKCSADKYFFNCPNGHKFDMTLYNFTHGHRCASCRK
jgi:hypothetical protein